MSGRARLMPTPARAEKPVASHVELRLYGDGLFTVRALSAEATPVTLSQVQFTNEQLGRLGWAATSFARQPEGRLPLTLVLPACHDITTPCAAATSDAVGGDDGGAGVAPCPAGGDPLAGVADGADASFHGADDAPAGHK